MLLSLTQMDVVAARVGPSITIVREKVTAVRPHAFNSTTEKWIAAVHVEGGEVFVVAESPNDVCVMLL